MHSKPSIGRTSHARSDAHEWQPEGPPDWKMHLRGGGRTCVEAATIDSAVFLTERFHLRSQAIDALTAPSQREFGNTAVVRLANPTHKRAQRRRRESVTVASNVCVRAPGNTTSAHGRSRRITQATNPRCSTEFNESHRSRKHAGRCCRAGVPVRPCVGLIAALHERPRHPDRRTDARRVRGPLARRTRFISTYENPPVGSANMREHYQPSLRTDPVRRRAYRTDSD